MGITDFAQAELGDVVFVDLPELGTMVEKGEAVAAVESVKSSNDIYAPVSGEIVAINSELEESPDLINTSAHGDGWICGIKLSDPSELEALLDSVAYAKHAGEAAEDH